MKRRKPPATTTASVSWSQVTGATGYRVYWGTTTHIYSFAQDVGSALNYIVPNLTVSKMYYFSAKASNASGMGPYANEVAYTAA